MEINLVLMTKQLMRQFFREFTYDPDTLPSKETYMYSPEHADAYFDRYRRPDCVHYAIMREDEVIGDLQLKRINSEKRSCIMSIHMKNDTVKNKGYGTKAEQIALAYAFECLRLETVYADALIENTRSRHVLCKVGFRELQKDEKFCYYVCHKADWRGTASL